MPFEQHHKIGKKKTHFVVAIKHIKIYMSCKSNVKFQNIKLFSPINFLLKNLNFIGYEDVSFSLHCIDFIGIAHVITLKTYW
jgi:hypothetical protein